VEVVLLSRVSLQIVRRTHSAPNFPETTFFGSLVRGSCTGACSRLTAQSAFVRVSNAQVPFKGSRLYSSAKQKGSSERLNMSEKKQRCHD
jgi:hypothetical protein